MGRSNFLRAFVSLVVLLVLFVIYSVTVVPAIEPNFERRMSVVRSSGSTKTYLGEFGSQIAQLFPPDAWESQSPRVLRDDRRKTAMLFKTYEILSGGGIRITPCTVIYGSAGIDKNGQEKPPLIMQAPDGATIYFDKPIDLSAIDLGHPESGQLLGRVRIQRKEDSTGRGGLVIDTSNVHITADGLMTPNDFDFEFEKSYGSGNNLIIEVDKIRRGQKPNLDILQSIELVSLHKLYLNPQTADPLGGDSPGISPNAKKDVPTQITCRGPCRIDFRRNTLSFSKSVDLRRLNENGPPDVLECDALTIFFSKLVGAEPNSLTSNARKKSLDFKVKRLLATGNPVKLSAPSRFAYLRGSRLEYDMSSRKFRMTSTTQSFFRHVNEDAEHRLAAPQITYNASKDGSVGTLLANGQGSFNALLIEKRQTISVHWDRQLSLSDHEHGKLLAIDGNVEANLATTGIIQAGKVNIWLEPSPVLPSISTASHKRTISLRPKRIVATQQVDFDSPQLTAQCARLETIFAHGLPTSATDSADVARVRPAAMTNRRDPGQRLRNRFTSDNKPNQQQDAVEGANNPAAKDNRKVQLTGSTIALALTMQGQEIRSIDQIDVKGNARFRELVSANSDGQPLAINAHAFRLNNPDSIDAFVQATGAPTVITTGDIKVKATNVQLDRKKNLVWSNGSGEAKIPIEKDFQGNQLQKAGVATVTWQKAMEFDGSLMELHGDAFVDGPEFQMRADHLQARLDRKIDFSVTKSSKPEVELISAQDNVRAIYETREFGKLISSTYMQVPNATINALNGNVSVEGTGQIMITKRGFSGQDFNNGISKAKTSRDPKVGQDKRLTFLQINFQSGVVGNIEKRVLEFNRNVKTIYGPVYDWDQKINPDGKLQEDDVLMSCDKLILAQGPRTVSGGTPIDLRAIGNTFVEGKSFQAAGEQINYDQAKDMLTIRGGGSRDAQIRYEDAKGSTIDKSFRELRFFPGERRAEASEVPVLEFRTFGK